MKRRESILKGLKLNRKYIHVFFFQVTQNKYFYCLLIICFHSIFKGWFALREAVISHLDVSAAAKNVDAIFISRMTYKIFPSTSQPVLIEITRN